MADRRGTAGSCDRTRTIPEEPGTEGRWMAMAVASESRPTGRQRRSGSRWTVLDAADAVEQAHGRAALMVRSPWPRRPSSLKVRNEPSVRERDAVLKTGVSERVRRPAHSGHGFRWCGANSRSSRARLSNDSQSLATPPERARFVVSDSADLAPYSWSSPRAVRP